MSVSTVTPYPGAALAAPPAASANPVASVNDLTVRYGSRTIIDQLNLSIPHGCVGLLGPNGAGKSTLIKTLLGFLTPARGQGQVLGMNIRTERLQIRQRIGLMPEQDCHIPGMNAVSFVAYAGELAGMPGDQALRRAHEVLEYCGLGEARYRDVETYSTGMKQRIKLAQALVHGPRLVLLDEPTNGLDPQGRDAMLDLIRDISHAKDVSVIVSSHLLPDIERTCDAVIVMKGGQVKQQGPIDALRETGTLSYEIELRLWIPAFAESLASRGGKLVSRQGTQCRFDWEITDAGAAVPGEIGRRIFQASRESGAQVRGFRPAQRSLQDIFMEAVEA